MAEPARLPAVKDDPAIAKGYTIQNAYNGEMMNARNKFGASDIDKARAVVKVWKTTCTQLAALYQDLQARRNARREWLERQLPIGPGIPPGVSPADRAVLMTAWSNALEKVRTTSAVGTKRREMFAEAKRFGDEVLQRALLTVSLDESAPGLEDYAAQYSPDAAAHLEEWQELGSLIAGQHFDNAWVVQALGQPKQPQERYDLPAMVNAHNVAARVHNSSNSMRSGNRPMIPIIELDPDEL